MSHNVYLLVSFPCDSNAAIASLAKKHLDALNVPNDRWGVREAVAFLTDLSTRTGRNPGVYGGLLTWSYKGNYTDEKEFLVATREFFTELLTAEIDGGPDPLDQVLILVQHEGCRIEAHEIRYVEALKGNAGYKLTGVTHTTICDCPFSWEKPDDPLIS